VQLGDKETWGFLIDADCRLQSFCLQYQKLGKNFFWQKFDQQQQFHLTKEQTLEQVCAKTLIRVHKKGVKIEIKKELDRFEDSFYEFQQITFEGIPITVSSFAPYRIPGFKRLIFLVINSKSEIRVSNRPQYLVVLDIDRLTGHLVELEANNQKLKISKLFFCSPTFIMVESKFDSIYNIICEYELKLRVGNSGNYSWQIIKHAENISIKLRRITSFAFDE